MTKYDDNLFEDTKYDESLFEDTQYDESLFESPEQVLSQAPKSVISEQVESTEPSKLEALGRGAVQGATLGFGEEIGAAGLSAFDLLRRKLGIETEEEKVNRQLQEQGFTGTGKTAQQKDVLSQYREMRDISREAEKQAEEAHPRYYFGGEIAGGIAPAIATGGAGAVAQVGKTGLKQLAKEGAKAGAKFGGAEALGRTEADITKGEVGQALKETATGTVAGATLGAGLPVVGEGLKKVIPKNIKDTIYDKAPRMLKKILASTSMGRKGEEVVGQSVEEAQLQKMTNLSTGLQDFLEESRQGANNLIKEALDPNVKIKVTDQYGKYVDDLGKKLKEFAPDSDEAKQINNAIATLNNQRQEILGSAMPDPKLPTKAEALEKLQNKLDVIKFQNEIGVPQAKTVGKLFDKAAKIKGAWKPDMATVREIKAVFNLENEDQALNMLRDVMKLNYKKIKVNPKTREITEVPVELREVIKKYTPQIKEREGKVYLERGPGQVRESEVLPFRPERVEAPLELNPQQLRSAEASLKDIAQKSDPGGIIYGTAKEIRNLIKEGLPKELAQKFEQGMATHSEINRVKDLIDQNLISKFQGAEKTKATQALNNLMEQQHGFGGAGQAKTAEIRKDILGTISRIDPKFGAKYAQETADTAKRIDLNRIGDAAGLSKESLIGGAIEAAGVRAGAGIGGYVLRPIDKIASLGKEGLEKIATQVAEKAPKLSRFLGNLANVESESRRRALIFSASQQSDLKDDLASLFGLEDESELEE